ncbi:hypothetical protein IMY05_005G0050900 [Salix suchowensis]|nr:hypothetical protein IMY05_005G0050900 [Salix suchowensis]
MVFLYIVTKRENIYSNKRLNLSSKALKTDAVSSLVKFLPNNPSIFKVPLEVNG